jgi:uncharacterized protein YndB with AHSA1/START domain
MGDGRDDMATRVTRLSDTELEVRRTFAAPVSAVYAAWSDAAIMRRWWVPPSFGVTLTDCAMDVRTGGTYRFTFAHPDAPDPMVFHGRYIDVVPGERIVWTNEESDAGPVTTLTFAAVDGGTRVVLHERHPSAAALDEALGGSATAFPDQFAALDRLLAD